MTEQQSSAVAVIEQDSSAEVVEWSLDGYGAEAYNRLVPVDTIMIPTDLLRPVVQVVRLNPDPEKGGDVYRSNDMPAGHAAPTRVALRKLATAAGISFLDEHRTDDGRDPDVIEVTCTAEMLMPTGQRIRATGTKRIDLNAQAWASPNHRAKYKSFFQEHVASRAQNRAIRALLSLRGSYPLEVYRKPFAVVSFAPNMAHPEVRSRILDAMAPVAAQLYGGSAAQQLAAGPTIDVTPAPEEDPAPATPTVLPGEKLAAAAATSTPEEPEWMRGSAPAAKPVEKAKPADFATSIRDTAAAVEDPEAIATPEQLAGLRDIFAGWRGPGVVAGGLNALWPDTDPERLAAGQAQALATVHDSMGHDKFEAAWRAMLDKAAVTA